MKNLRSVRGICKTGKRPFMRLFTSDYRDGTAQLSFELQGFYFRILTYLHDGERVPADAAELARFLQCSPRTTRAFVPKLIAAGKLYEANGELRNKRVDRDLEPMSASDETELEPTSNPIEPEVEPNSGRESQIIESNQSQQKHTMEITTSISNSIPEDSPTSVFTTTPGVKKPTGRPGMDFWSKAVNPEPLAEHRTVTLTDDGVIVLHNGTRAKWLAMFGGDADRLDLALTQAAGWVQPHSSRPLQAQVEAQLARAAAEKLDKDQRYAAAAAKSAPVGNGSNILAILDSRKGAPA